MSSCGNYNVSRDMGSFKRGSIVSVCHLAGEATVVVLLLLTSSSLSSPRLKPGAVAGSILPPNGHSSVL